MTSAAHSQRNHYILPGGGGLLHTRLIGSVPQDGRQKVRSDSQFWPYLHDSRGDALRMRKCGMNRVQQSLGAGGSWRTSACADVKQHSEDGHVSSGRDKAPPCPSITKRHGCCVRELCPCQFRNSCAQLSSWKPDKQRHLDVFLHLFFDLNHFFKKVQKLSCCNCRGNPLQHV